MTATVTRHGVLDMQVCVPSEWDDEQVKRFAEREYPCGTRNGWSIRSGDDPRNQGYPERNPCAELPDHVHIILEA